MMKYTVLELNDICLTVNNEQNQLTSPAYALIKDNQIAFGTTASELHRLYPMNTHKDYWLKLDQNPLQSSSKHIRHNADLAFMHLADIHEEFKQVENWLIAVPSNYTSEQLALLLGLLNTANFKNVKLIDSALLASSQASVAGEYMYIDLQLHQSIITDLHANTETSVKKSHGLQEVSRLGIEAIIEKVINDELLNQSRFDSHHNAETEQLVFNLIPDVLENLSINPVYGIEIEFHGHTHKAIIKQETVIQALKPLFETIRNNVNADKNIILSHRLHSLPGCKEIFNTSIYAEENSLFKAASHYSEYISNTEESLNYLSVLPKDNIDANTKESVTNTLITHILVNHQAYALNKSDHYFNNNHVSSDILDNSSSYAITYADNQYWLKAKNNANVLLNKNHLASDVRLEPGDKISIADSNTVATLICVK